MPRDDTTAHSAKVPLLEMQHDGTVMIESSDIARHLSRGTSLYPSNVDSESIDSFVSMWCTDVEPAYYSILRAEAEPQVRFAVAEFISALSLVEDRLWQQRMAQT